jgi:hypothetical protein
MDTSLMEEIKNSGFIDPLYGRFGEGSKSISDPA